MKEINRLLFCEIRGGGKEGEGFRNKPRKEGKDEGLLAIRSEGGRDFHSATNRLKERVGHGEV